MSETLTLDEYSQGPAQQEPDDISHACPAATQTVSTPRPTCPALSNDQPIPESLSNQRLEAACLILGGWMWEMDGDLKFSYFTRSVKTIAGKDPEWHYGKTRVEIGNLDPNCPEIKKHLEQLNNHEEFEPFEFQRTENGRTIRMRTVGKPLFHRDGSFRGYQGFAFDITREFEAEAARNRALEKLKSAESQLEFQNAQFKSAISNMRQGLAMFDHEGNITVWNDQFLDLMCIPRHLLPCKHEELVAYWQAKHHFLPPFSEAEFGLAANQSDQCLDSRLSNTTDETASGRIIAAHREACPRGGWVVTYDDITHQRLAEKRIRRLAEMDSLTGIANRASFDSRLKLLVEQVRPQELLPVMIIDLDGFKTVNDTLGHQAGDELLKQVASRLMSCTRDNDFVARIGGDEFALIQTSAASTADSQTMAERIVTALSHPYEIKSEVIVISASVGIALAPKDGTSPSEILKNADVALYEMKANGKSGCRFYDKALKIKRDKIKNEQGALQRALKNREFELHYQPIFCARTGLIASCEALLRWRHPTKGLRPPVEFIGLAEETGMIVEIGNWAIEQACADACEWPESVGVSVNVSPIQLLNPSLEETIYRVLDKSRLSPGRLEIEVTESAFIGGGTCATERLQRLSAAGIQIALDDFGTGFSSLSLLQQAPFTRLKVDRSFVRELPESVKSMNIVRSIISLSLGLGLKVTVEGVETQEQLATVKREGCSHIQGYIYSKPQPKASIEKFFVALAAS